MRIKISFLFFILFVISIPSAYSQTIACGYAHNLAICNEETVVGWGNGTFDALPGSSTTFIPIPINISGVKAVTAGYYASYALKYDSTVWAWGHNYYGEMGNGSTFNVSNPIQIPSLNGIVAVAAGMGHFIVLKNDSTVWACGQNNYGQLGNGTQDNFPHSSLTQVSGLSGIIAIAAGHNYSFAVKNDGTAWAWGYNGFWQLGDSTPTTRTTPVQVHNITGVIAVAAGEGHSLALKNDGTVWGWGRSNAGQAGTGGGVPLQIANLTGVIAIEAGSIHSIALKNDGTVWTWGSNAYGRLGIGTSDIAAHPVPVHVSSLSNMTAVAGGQWHVATMKSDETAWAWGYNAYGQTGDSTANETHAPFQVANTCSNTGIEENSFNATGLFISPSINNGRFMLTIHELLNVTYSLQIFNSLGEKVHHEIFCGTQKEIRLNNPQAGIYFARVSDGEKVFVSKIVVQK